MTNADDPLRNLFTTTLYHTMGIVPIYDKSKDVNRQLAELPPDEARKMKRKFRKIWRRLARGASKCSNEETDAEARSYDIYDYLKIQMGYGEEKASRQKKIRRKSEVALKVKQSTRSMMKIWKQKTESENSKDDSVQ